MLERILRLALLFAIVCLPLAGCGYMTKQGRQQIAYQRYVRKCSGRKMKMARKIKAPKMPLTPGPSDNRIHTEVSGAPQSVTSAQSQASE
jgi:hypothetical protein